MKVINFVIDKATSEFRKYPLETILLALFLFVAFFVRSYRADDLMGFYFDQGRDALVIWRFWNEGKPFLIGPVTGLEGIFLGPLFYYLIAPFYLIGSGNPLYPAIFLAFTSTVALFVLYILGTKIHSRATGLIAVIIGSLSYYTVLSGRWLSNPTPILLTSVLLFWTLWEIANGGTKKLWMLVALIVGVSLQFEAASATFYIPIVVVFAISNVKQLPSLIVFLYSFLIFFSTLVPQIIFNIRHENLLFANFIKVIFADKSFKVNFLDVLNLRLTYFWDVYQSKLFLGLSKYSYAMAILSFISIIYSRFSLNRHVIPLFTIFFSVPAFFYIFFQGNHGNIYDYYLTGYYLPLILFFSLGLGIIWRSQIGKFVIIIFLVSFVYQNSLALRNLLTKSIYENNYVVLGNQKKAISWIQENASVNKITKYNVDVYVPPVIPHTYDYLFLWLNPDDCIKNTCGYIKYEETKMFYVLYEVDPPHPERLEAWLSKYEDTEIIEQKQFGGIFVQLRQRNK